MKGFNMATYINIYIAKASNYEIIFSAKDSNDEDISDLTKEDIRLYVNNNSFENFRLILPSGDTFQYRILIDEDSVLDNYDVILFLIDGDLYKSDIYIIYLYQSFYLGESLSLLPNLPVDTTKDSTLIIDFVKANNEDLSNISGQQVLCSGVGSESSITIDNPCIINIPINVNIDLKNQMGDPVMDSRYNIDIKIVRQ